MTSTIYTSNTAGRNAEVIKPCNRDSITVLLQPVRNIICEKRSSSCCTVRPVDISLTFMFFLCHLSLQYKLAVIAALIGSAAAFAPSAQVTRSTAIGQHIGAGGMADTRDPDAYEDEDPRKSISAAPSFEEYLKQRAAEDGK